jgi:hypothetical protein
MPDDTIRLTTSVNVAPIQQGMAAASAAVSDATAKMETNFKAAAAASNSLGTAAQQMAARLQATGLSANDTAAALKNLGFSAEEVAGAVGQVETQLNAVAPAAARATTGVNNARIAFTGLTQDLGLRGSRALGSFIAQSESLGPILRAAFPIVAALAFIELLDAGVNKLIEFTSALAGWDKEAQKMYSHLVDLNQAQVKFNAELDIEKLSLSEVGLKGAALDRQKLINLKVEELIIQEKLNESSKREQALADQLATLKHPNVLGIFPDKEKIAEVDKELQKAVDTTQQWTDKLKTLQQVTIPKTGMEEVARATEDAQKAAEKYANALERLRDEDTALTQREAEKELRELEKAAEERERLEEEMEKTTLEMAKKDLEDFRHSIEEKISLAEDLGKAQLEQINQIAKAQEDMARKTALSKIGGDEEAAAIATRAFEREADVVAHLIALQEELRQKLIASGVAASDPAVERTLKTEQDLIRQLNVDWQKMQHTVETQAQQIAVSYKNAFTSISTALNQNLIQWMAHTQSFGQAMIKMWNDIAASVITSLLKTAEQMVANLVLQNSILDGTKIPTAAKAARDAFTSVMGALPFPINVAVAPEVAAAAFAAVMAFEQGGIVPATSMAMVHRGEMVLPAHISQSVQQMAAGGGGGSAPMHIHFHGDPSKSAQDMTQMENTIVDVMKRAQRRGRIPLHE